MLLVLLLSGPIAVGKTSVANALVEQHQFRCLKSSDYLKSICKARSIEVSRATLQSIGDDLDEATDFRWLVDDVAGPQISTGPQHQRWLVDSVRKQRQIEHFRAAFEDTVLHVHLWASDSALQERYARRRSSSEHAEGPSSYEVAVRHPNEISSRSLKDSADLAIRLESIDAELAAAAAVLVGNKNG